MINILLTISSMIIAISVLYYLLRSIICAVKALSRSSDEMYVNEAEKLLLSNIKVPVSIIVPPIERYASLEKIIKASVEIDHPMYEVIVMLTRDSSHLNRLISEFGLVRLEAVYRMVIKSAGALHTYRSTTEKRLSVIVSDSSKKRDAINLGIDAARYPFICIFSEDYIPSKDLLLVLEPPVISNEEIQFGSITSTGSDFFNMTSWHYIRSIYAYSNLFSFSIPSDFAVLLKKRFIIEKNGMRRDELLPEFLRRMMREGLRLIPVTPTGGSSESERIFINILCKHLKKVVCEMRLSTPIVIINDIYYSAFLLLNFLLFYMLFSETESGISYLTPILFIFVIIPLKDIMILLIEDLLQKKTDGPHLIRSIFLTIIKQTGIEQIISVLFLCYSLRRFLKIRG